MEVTFRFKLFEGVSTPLQQKGIVIGNLIDQTNTILCVVRLDNLVGDVYWVESMLSPRKF